MSLTLASIAVVSLAALAVREIQLAKHSRFANTLPLQENASELLRDVRNFLRRNALRRRRGEALSNDVLGRARRMIEDVLTSYSTIFGIICGTRCRMCIKLVTVQQRLPAAPDPNDVFVFALARDKDSAKENEVNDKRRENERLDRLTDN